MSIPMKKRHTKQNNDVICLHHAGHVYLIPVRVAEKYRIPNEPVEAKAVFANINKKYTKAGALLRGLRIREGLTQVEMARKIQVTQSDISQMEHGTRTIGRKIAQRIEKCFGVDYHAFLE